MSVVQRLIVDHLDSWSAADTEKKTRRGRSAGNAGGVYGINKVRELIYEMAAVGRLIESAQNAKECLLGEIAEFVMGQAPPGSECNNNGEGVVFVKTGEFGALYPETKEWTTKPLKFAKAGDVLICVVGATIGKLNLAIDCAIGRSVAAIRPNQFVDTKYLYIALVPFTLRLREKSRGSAQGVIGKTELSAVKIRIPSIDEQKQIVAKVDELMALCDQLEARHVSAVDAHEKLVRHLLGTLTDSQNANDFADRWQRIAAYFDTLFITEASIDELKQTLLQLAVMGKLVPQDPNDEPASELLKKAQVENTKLIEEGKVKCHKKLAHIADYEALFQLPIGWKLVRKAEVFNFLNGYAFKSEWFQPSGVKLLRNVNVSHGNVNWEDAVHVSAGRAENYAEFTLSVGDIVLSLDRPIISTGLKYAVVTELDTPCLLLQRVAKISSLNQCVIPEYLTTWLKSPFFINKIDPGRSNGVPHISTRHIADMIFALPPLAEQHRIVAKVDELMALCDQLNSRIAESSRLQQKLADTLIEQAVA